MIEYRNGFHRSLAGTLALGALLLGMLAPTAGHAQECEIPLFVKQNMFGANVEILADNSSSMNTAIYDLRFDKNMLYAGPFEPEATYFVAKDGNYSPGDFDASFAGYYAVEPVAYLVNSDNGEDGRYPGNYLNWIYSLSDADRKYVPGLTRIQVLKSVLTQVITRSQRLNFGIAVFNNESGGNLIGKIGKSHNALTAIIAGITANAWTPLGEAMESILDYFADTGPDAPIQVECQYNFLLVVTDGLPTKDVDVSGYLHDADGDGNDPGSCTSIGSPYPDDMDCSDHFDDVAWYMAHEDLRPDMDGDQNVITYVVGFHEDGGLLQEAAANGDGLFFHAENAVELYLSIEYALQDILRRISAGSAVAVVSTERGYDDRLYRGKFMPIDWHGFLECYALPYQEGDEALWEAGEFLRSRSRSSRRIFTAIEDKAYEFVAGNASRLRDAMGAVTDDEAAALINWGRGSYVNGYRNRQGWVLGDIVHSTPVVVGAPAEFIVEESYQNFQQNQANRRKMVYVGANDGMLHAFDAQTGTEVWAFVPEFALPAFAVMADSAYCHKYTVDQTVSVKDVNLNGSWSTVLVATAREGGSAVYALDITVPDSPSVLWQAEIPYGKKFPSEVEVVSIGGVPVALIGSGLDEDTFNSYLHAYNVESGDHLGSILLSRGSSRNKASRPAVIDVNLDGETDLVYIADLLGNIYRLKVGGNPEPSAWGVSVLYQGTQEITADPVLSYGPNGAVYVYVGTGAYLNEDDMVSTTANNFLCVIDRHDGRTLTLRGLENQTSSVSEVGTGYGWYVNLWNSEGERVTQQAVVVAETVIFSSFTPNMDACVAGGESYLYQMRYDDGGVPDVDGMEEPADRSVSLGEGVASYPVVDLTEGKVVVQSSDASISVEPIANVYLRLTVRSWQESFDNVAPVNPVADGVTANK